MVEVGIVIGKAVVDMISVCVGVLECGEGWIVVVLTVACDVLDEDLHGLLFCAGGRGARGGGGGGDGAHTAGTHGWMRWCRCCCECESVEGVVRLQVTRSECCSL